MTYYEEVMTQIDALETRLNSVDQLNQTLLTATTAYQIRMAKQELLIQKQEFEKEVLEGRIKDLLEQIRRGDTLLENYK